MEIGHQTLMNVVNGNTTEKRVSVVYKLFSTFFFVAVRKVLLCSRTTSSKRKQLVSQQKPTFFPAYLQYQKRKKSLACLFFSHFCNIKG